MPLTKFAYNFRLLSFPTRMNSKPVGFHGIKGTTLYAVFDSKKDNSTVKKAVQDGELTIIFISVIPKLSKSFWQ